MKLKDVLHLYLGIDCKYEWINEPKTELNGKITTSIIYSVYADNGVIQWVKPILRPLSDMTEEEEDEIGINSKYHLGNNNSDSFYFHPFEFQYLLKQGFDLFGLIESGQAIDKTTL